MDKTGEVRTGVTRCDVCGSISAVRYPDGRVRCSQHTGEGTKEAAAEPTLKSFSEPLDEALPDYLRR